MWVRFPVTKNIYTVAQHSVVLTLVSVQRGVGVKRAAHAAFGAEFKHRKGGEGGASLGFELLVADALGVGDCERCMPAPRFRRESGKKRSRKRCTPWLAPHGPMLVVDTGPPGPAPFPARAVPVDSEAGAQAFLEPWKYLAKSKAGVWGVV